MASRFYAQETWDVASWVDIIAIEYETLIQAYPFEKALDALSPEGTLDLLDVGCGTAIFPGYLEEVLSDDIHFHCDLLDISKASLAAARKRLSEMNHFTVGRTYRALIEELPAVLAGRQDTYDVIWAIHSFTTVDVGRMRDVYAALLEALRPGGFLYVYQLSAESSYQTLHGYYRACHPDGQESTPFMEFEDSRAILDSMDIAFEVYPLRFAHEIPADLPDLLEKYLQKCILEDSVDTLRFFEPLLAGFLDTRRQIYAFPQSVNFIEVRK